MMEKTTIQKLVYLSSQKIPELDIPPYAEHYYGPFSPGLGIMLEKAYLYSFIYETNLPKTICQYGLTPDGKNLAKQVQKNHPDTFQKISDIVRVCKDSCRLEIHPLSYASKIRYLICPREHQNSMKFEDAVKYACKLGWNVPKYNVEQGAELLKHLGLDNP